MQVTNPLSVGDVSFSILAHFSLLSHVCGLRTKLAHHTEASGVNQIIDKSAKVKNTASIPYESPEDQCSSAYCPMTGRRDGLPKK